MSDAIPFDSLAADPDPEPDPAVRRIPIAPSGAPDLDPDPDPPSGAPSHLLSYELGKPLQTPDSRF